MASATAYGRRPMFVRAEHSATAEGENSAYRPTLKNMQKNLEKLLYFIWKKLYALKEYLDYYDFWLHIWFVILGKI